MEWSILLFRPDIFLITVKVVIVFSYSKGIYCIVSRKVSA